MDENLMRILDILPQYIGITDSELVCRFANKAYGELLHRTPQSMIGATIQELWGPELFAQVKPMLQRALAGESVSFRKRIHHLDGEYRFGRVDLLSNLEGGYFVVMTDLDGVERQQRDRESLVHELDHRVNNILQVLHSVLALEAQAADERTAKVLEAITVRVDALAISYELLTSQTAGKRWSASTLLDKVAAAIGPGMKVSVSAEPKLRIPSALTETFVFIAMELARWASTDGARAALAARALPEGIELSVEADEGEREDLMSKAGAAGIALVESLAARCGAGPLRGGARLSIIFPAGERREIAVED